MFEYYQESDWYSVPGGGGYAYVTFTAPSDSQIVSVGWQNQGNATALYAAQMFIYNNGQNAYLQVVNNSFSGTNVEFTYVYAPNSSTSDAAKRTATVAPKPVVQIGEGTK